MSVWLRPLVLLGLVALSCAAGCSGREGGESGRRRGPSGGDGWVVVDPYAPDDGVDGSGGYYDDYGVYHEGDDQGGGQAEDYDDDDYDDYDDYDDDDYDYDDDYDDYDDYGDEAGDGEGDWTLAPR